MRDLLKRLNREMGITILISSHLLAEVEKLVTHVGLIHKGRLLFQGALDELFKQQALSSHIVFETNDREHAAEIIRNLSLDYQMQNEKIILPSLTKEMIARLNTHLVKEGISVHGITAGKSDLETAFMNLTSR
jgi:lantibiotic transport system ATP-binding protein